ncbi:MAG: hypothetical protein AB1758_31115 [Candidatus Eremiobacterota bacterium]
MSGDESLERCLMDLELSYRCLALEQAACKQAEAAAEDARRGLALSQAEVVHLRARVAQLQEALVADRELGRQVRRALSEALSLEQESAREHRRLAREAMRAELQEQARLRGRLAGARDRIRELEELLRGPEHASPAAARLPACRRLWVDGWAACSRPS